MIEYETTFKSLGTSIQMAILKKNQDKASFLLMNPKIRIVIEEKNKEK